MADVDVFSLPPAVAVTDSDVFVATQGGASGDTNKPTALEIATYMLTKIPPGAPPAQVAYAVAVPLNLAGGHMAAHTIAAATTFTATGAVDGGSCTAKLTADGTNTPNFSAFTKAGASSWVNTAATVNLVTFFRVGGTNFYSVVQA